MIRSNSYDEQYGKYVFDHPQSLTKNPKIKTLFLQDQTFLIPLEKKLDFALLQDEGENRKEKENLIQGRRNIEGGVEKKKRLEGSSNNGIEGGRRNEGGARLETVLGREEEIGRKKRDNDEEGGAKKINYCKSATLPRKYGRRLEKEERVEEELDEEEGELQKEGEQQKEEENDKNSPNKSVNLCLVCYDSSPDAVFMDCGHGGICYRCSLELSKATGECFLCRKPIKQVLKLDLKERGEFFRVVEAAEVVDRL